jgi:hypothetical protein
MPGEWRSVDENELTDCSHERTLLGGKEIANGPADDTGAMFLVLKGHCEDREAIE